MEVEILVYEREPLLPSVTPKKFIDGSLCRVAQGAPLACSGLAPEDAVGRRSYAGGRDDEAPRSGEASSLEARCPACQSWERRWVIGSMLR